MRRSLGVSLALLLAISIVALAASPVRATPPRAVSTDGVITTREIIDVRFADGNALVSIVTTATYTGTWNGFATTDFEVVFYRTGAVSAHGVITCHDCTVEGRSGDLVYGVRFVLDATGVVRASSWQILDGTDGLAGIHGQGTLEQLAPLADPSPWRYVGQYHFDP